MPRYRYTGTQPAVFPSIVIDDGAGDFHTLEVEPGVEVDVPDVVEHPELEPADDVTRAAHTALAAAPAEDPADGDAPAPSTSRRPRRTASPEES
jgi:hypothetical protein